MAGAAAIILYLLWTTVSRIRSGSDEANTFDFAYTGQTGSATLLFQGTLLIVVGAVLVFLMVPEIFMDNLVTLGGLFAVLLIGHWWVESNDR